MIDDTIEAYADIIVNDLATSQCRFFFGAGVPIAEAGLPGFESLAVDLLSNFIKNNPDFDWCEKLIMKENISDAAPVFVKDIFPEQITELCFSKDRVSSKKHLYSVLKKANPEGKIYKGIEELANSGENLLDIIYTTNFDDSIRLYLGSSRAVIISSYPQYSMTSSSKGIKIIHLHGHVDEGDFLITESDLYKISLHPNPLYESVKNDLLYKTIVFVGYGFRDPSIQIIFTILNDLAKQDRRTHYAIFPSKFLDRNEDVAKAKWKLTRELWFPKGLILIDTEPAPFFEILTNKYRAMAIKNILEKIRKRRPDLNMTDIEFMVNKVTSAIRFPSIDSAASLLDLLL